MSEKSYVGMAFTVCPICGAKEEFVILDAKLRKSISSGDHFHGYVVCKECAALIADGYIALIECESFVPDTQSHAREKEITRTGRMAWTKKSAWSKIFNIPVPEKGMAYIGVDGMRRVQEIHDDLQGDAKA